MQLKVQETTVYIIGAPAPGEIKVKHPFQFVNAALYRGVDGPTICFVEKTGFENGMVDLEEVKSKLAPAVVEWVTPENSLVDQLNELGKQSIRRLIVYSHGLPGIVTLRYGWSGSANYGLEVAEIPKLKKEIFTADADVELHSCNGGSYSDQGVLAQDLATHINRPVQAWTGRTSYREVNDGNEDNDTSIKPSDKTKGGSKYLKGHDWTEYWRQYVEGRGTPELKTFVPLGEFDSSFEIHARLPQGENQVCVANGAAVEVTLQESRYISKNLHEPTNKVYITLRRIDRNWFGLDPDDSAGTKEFAVGKVQTQKWSGLSGGWHYLEISKDNPGAWFGYETIVGVLHVQVKPK